VKRVRALFLATLLAIAGGAAADDRPDPGPILVLGDSILAWNAEVGASVADAVKAKLGSEVVLAAVPGARVLAGPDPVPDQYVPGPWRWVVVQGGGNDLVAECGCGACARALDRLIGPDGRSGAIARLTRRIRADGAAVLLWSYYAMPGDAPFPFARCNDELVEVHARLARLAARDDGIVLVDGREAVRPDRTDLYDRDRVHPSAAGSRAIGVQVAEALLEADLGLP
jgi:lysophospholipase L1-like esterase